jgi:hypothetical protein
MSGAIFALLLSGAALAFGADPALIEKGKAEEKRCAGCHGLRIIGTQRLSRGGWERELDKMVRWGAEIRDREALLAYLVESYGDGRPPARPTLSAGSK